MAGLAKSTVSDALRNRGRVHPKTRKRVQALARKIGYVPNTIAAILASSKAGVPANALKIAFLITFRAYHWLRGEFFDFRFYDVRQHLQQLGYETEVFDVPSPSVAPSLRHLLFHRGYRGVIFGNMDVAAQKALLDQDWGPFCVIGSTRNFGLKFNLIRHNHFQAVCTAWSQARARGYTRIGLVLGRHDPVLVDDLERQGALAVLQRNIGKNETAIPPYLGKFTELQPGVMKWYLRARPDVVIGLNFSFSAALLMEGGVRIPQDVAFISLHADGAAPEFASVDPEANVAQIYAQQMDQMIRHQRTGAPEYPREILPSIRWVPGPSLPVKKMIDLPEPFRNQYWAPVLGDED
jgi:DNA-binding LacI/PurR family transcriptional regulator